MDPELFRSASQKSVLGAVCRLQPVEQIAASEGSSEEYVSVLYLQYEVVGFQAGVRRDWWAVAD